LIFANKTLFDIEGAKSPENYDIFLVAGKTVESFRSHTFGNLVERNLASLPTL
jgi:hypothetical protein